MAEKTGIAWTRSTFNPWIGCTKVSPGCDHCYAEALDNRHRWGGKVHWGVGMPRHRTTPHLWNQPRAWNRKAAETGERWLVFCASLADVFDNEVPQDWRADLFALIHDTPALTWLLLTKRIGNAAKMMAEVADDPWPLPLPNVWIGASVVNQEEADRDIPKLHATPAAKRFVSYEPALGPIDFRHFFQVCCGNAQPRCCGRARGGGCCGEPEQECCMQSVGLDWIIVGGESTQGAPARPFRTSYARDTVRQCRAAGVPVFVKQMGSFVVDRNDAGFDGCEPGAWPLRADGGDPVVEHEIHGYQENYQGADCRVRLVDRAGAEPAEWPEDLRVQEFPS